MKFKHFLTGMALAAAVTSQAADAKYIFYFIGDGMGLGPVMATAAYNRMVRGSEQLPLMMTFPVAGQVMTYSASSGITDSAAAGTALASSHKTKNGMLGMDADTVAVYSIAEDLKKHGYGIGVISTCNPDDATPGAYYAHVDKRSEFETIDRQFIDGKVDFLAGASLKGLKDKDGNDNGTLALYDKNKIRVAHGLDELAKIDRNNASKIILLDKNPFQSGNVGYAIDAIPGNLTLPQMTQACLDYLEAKSPDRFFMMVEGGVIDHALHGNDGFTAIREIENFNEAMEIAYKFYLAHPDETLIVVSADHDTGGMALGNKENGYVLRLERLQGQKVSKEMFSDYCKKVIASGGKYTWADMEKYLKDNLGFWGVMPVTEKQTEKLREQFEKTFVKGNDSGEKTLYNDFNGFASAVFKVMSTNAAVGWTTTAHTGGMVPVYAIGAGAEKFSSFNNNTQLPVKIMEAAGYKF